MQSYDTIIVGLGASGCAAASKLAQAGKKVLGLEAQERVGGRVKTVPFGNGVVEVGAEWIHGTDNSVTYELALKNNVSILPQGLDFEVYRSDGSLVNRDLIKELLTLAMEVQDYPPPDPEPLGQFIKRKLTEHLQEKHPKVLEDQEFIEEFFKFLDLVVDNYEASNSWYDVSTASKFQDLGGNQHMSWHTYGYKTLFDILLNTYNNGPGYPNLDIKLNTEVTNIEWPQEPNEKVKVMTKDGSTYTADNVIVTVSVGVLKERHTTLFTPVLPQIKQTAIDNIDIGVVSKIILSFDPIWWSNYTYFGFIWRTSDRREVKVNDHWLTCIESVSMSMGSNNSVELWNNGDSAIMEKGHTDILYMSEQGFGSVAFSRIHIIHASLFTPALPTFKATAIDKIAMGVLGKVILSFPTDVCTRKNFTPLFFWKKEDSLKEGPIWGKVIGITCPMGANNAVTVWMCGPIAASVETLPEEEVKSKAMGILRKFLGKDMDIPEPTGMIRSNWHSNPFTRGSYTYDNINTPQFPNSRRDLAAPLLDSAGNPRVLFAGEASNAVHFSTVHGALETGYREAKRILEDKKVSYDTIIVGLGAAGCGAASKLAQSGKKVLALEAQERIGGRVKTVPFGNGVVEVGAEWIHGTNNSVTYELALKNNISVLSQGLDFEVYRSDGSRANHDLILEMVNLALEVQEHPPPDPEPLGQFITRKVMERIQEKHPKVLEDQEFIDELLIFLDLFVDNYEASNNWNDVTTGSKYQDLGGSIEMSWHRHGYRTLFEILLNTYNEGPGYPNLDIKLNTEVTNIEWPQEPNAKVKVMTKDGSTYTADNVIVTVSVGVLKERHHALFTPPLPPQKAAAIEFISIGTVGKIILSFDKPIWDRKSMWALFFWNVQDKREIGKKDYWTTRLFGASSPIGASNVVTIWTSGDTGNEVETLPEEEVKSKAMGILRKFLGKDMDIPEPTGMIRSAWHSCPFTRGSYTYDNNDTPKYPNAREDLAEPLLDSAGKPRVLFAGEASNEIHFSTVHGAVETGYREAMRLLPTTSKI